MIVGPEPRYVRLERQLMKYWREEGELLIFIVVGAVILVTFVAFVGGALGWWYPHLPEVRAPKKPAEDAWGVIKWFVYTLAWFYATMGWNDPFH